MHVFQPYPIDSIEINPFTIQGKNGLCITTRADGEIDVTASLSCTFGRLWEKNIVCVYIRESRYTRELIDKSEFFSLTFFKDEAYKNSIKFLKASYKKDDNKIIESGLTINKHIDIPFIDEGDFVILCDKLTSFPVTKDSMSNAFINPRIRDKYYSSGDFHHIFVGEILQVLAR